LAAPIPTKLRFENRNSPKIHDIGLAAPIPTKLRFENRNSPKIQKQALYFWRVSIYS